jgi:hypothetical protein
MKRARRRTRRLVHLTWNRRTRPTSSTCVRSSRVGGSGPSRGPSPRWARPATQRGVLGGTDGYGERKSVRKSTLELRRYSPLAQISALRFAQAVTALAQRRSKALLREKLRSPASGRRRNKSLAEIGIPPRRKIGIPPRRNVFSNIDAISASEPDRGRCRHAKSLSPYLWNI